MKRTILLLSAIIFYLAGYSQPMSIKGICYDIEQPLDLARIKKDIALFKQANINTVLVYTAIEIKQVLDSFWAAGIQIVTVFPYSDDKSPSLANGSFLDYINKYKQHPAIQMWVIGNAVNYSASVYQGKIGNWYSMLKNFADAIKLSDSAHQVTVIHGGVPPEEIVKEITSIDIWGVMVFTNEDVSNIIKQWDERNTKPMFIVSGIDSYNNKLGKETYESQAKSIKNLLQSVFTMEKTKCSGICLHSFADNHRAMLSPKQEIKGMLSPEGKFSEDGISDVEYFGIVKMNRKKKKAFWIVSQVYKTSFRAKL